MRVAVVGAGPIGLAIAWRCAARGLTTTVLDPAPGSGAAAVSAGMLAPDTEVSFGEDALATLLADSAARWPGFAAELTGESGLPLGYRTDGTLQVAVTAGDLAEVDRLRALQTSLGRPVRRLGAADLRDLEPLLTPRVRGGAVAPDDHQVDPRRLVAALRVVTDGMVAPLAVDRLEAVDADVVVVAAGCGSAALTGLPVRPVKGQVVRLRAPGGGPPGFRHVIRGYVDGHTVYLVPRQDGEVVVGATVEERLDTLATAGAVADLVRTAIDLVPELADYTLAEVGAGLRPATPDNAPILGALSARVVVATGHYRHGIVLTPVTADLIADLVATGTTPAALDPFAPGRFR